jgi:hypothetical protein
VELLELLELDGAGGAGLVAICTSCASAALAVAALAPDCWANWQSQAMPAWACAMAAASAAAMFDGGVGPASGATCGAGVAGGGGGDGIGNGTASILAQAAVTAALVVMPAFCWRLTALYIAMAMVSTMTVSSMPTAWDGACPVISVATPATESTIWSLTRKLSAIDDPQG